MTTAEMTSTRLEELLGDDAAELLQHESRGIPASSLHLPGPDFLDRVWLDSDRTPQVLKNLQWLVTGAGRLAGTGYISILPVDQGIEHSAGASFAPNPEYFDPGNIVKLALEGGCNAVASTVGVLGAVSRRYAHKIPFIVKLNHNEFLSYPNAYDQIKFSSVQRAWDLGAAGVGATIYFGSEESRGRSSRSPRRSRRPTSSGCSPCCGATCATPRSSSTASTTSSPPTSAAGQPPGRDDPGGHHQAEAPENNGGYTALNRDGGVYGKTNKLVYDKLTTDNPIDLTRYQLANCYMGRVPLINSGGASAGETDLTEAVKTAVINKRAGGMGLISGRKAFQRPMDEGVGLLHAVQDVYLNPEVTIA
jgi:class I fructose-bisphosphate aldolase